MPFVLSAWVMVKEGTMGNVTDKEWEAEIEDFPESVKAVARKYPANICWRSTEDPEFHYCIIDYARAKNKETGEEKITVTLAHSSGTRRAGIATFGQDPTQLIRCGCGKWKAPTQEDKKRQAIKLGEHRRKRQEALKDPLKIGDLVTLKGVDEPEYADMPLPVVRVESQGVHIWVGSEKDPIGPLFRHDLERYSGPV